MEHDSLEVRVVVASLRYNIHLVDLMLAGLRAEHISRRHFQCL